MQAYQATVDPESMMGEARGSITAPIVIIANKERHLLRHIGSHCTCRKDSSGSTDYPLATGNYSSMCGIKLCLAVSLLFSITSFCFSIYLWVQTLRAQTNSHSPGQPFVGTPPSSPFYYDDPTRKYDTSNDVCLPCEDIRQSALKDVDETARFRRRFEISADGEQVLRVCCVNYNNATQLADLFSTFVERKINDRQAIGSPWDNVNAIMRSAFNTNNGSGGGSSAAELSHVAAHLLIDVPIKQPASGDGGTQRVRSWRSDADLAHNRNIQYRNGSLLIPSDGMYYVYSQIYFMEYASQKSGGIGGSGGGQQRSHHRPLNPEMQRISHYMFRENLLYPNSGAEKLLQHSETKCWESTLAYYETTSLLGGVFWLRAGDELYVSVSDLSIVHTDMKSTFFGLFKLGV